VMLAVIVVGLGAFRFSLHHIFIAAAMDASRGYIQSTVASLVYGAAFLGTFSPTLAGMIVDEFGTPSAFLYGGTIGLVATVILLMLKLSNASEAHGESSMTEARHCGNCGATLRTGASFCKSCGASVR